ncbi:hypothetical protein YG5714_2987 [Sulfolobus islandicus Y.G.57.14]|uniref:Uncharacterized protein n=1 Tax=Saccharolobus islandicus (strain Y.G.57.14 / Yellowstone \|nr:hypothetical protein YG5714_2987 [Sulfolobus islandicus Y.G.57.14]
MPSTWIIGFSSFRRYVEFFGIFLIGGLTLLTRIWLRFLFTLLE